MVETLARRAARGTAYRVAGFLLVESLVPILLTPYMLNSLGSEAYGVWILFGTLAGWVGFADLGIGAGVVRFAARHRASGDLAALRRLVATAIAACLAAAAVIVLAAMAGGAPLVLGLAGESARPYLAAFPAVIAAAAVGLVTRAAAGILTGLGRIETVQGVNLVVGLAGAAATVLALWSGAGLSGLALVLLAGAVVNAAVTGGLLARASPAGRFVHTAIAGGEFTQVVRFGFVLHLMAVLGYVFQSDRLFLAATGQPLAVVTAYHLGALFVGKASALVVQLAAAVYPTAAGMTGERQRLENLALRGTKLQALVAGLLLGFVVAFADELLALWLGRPLPEAAAVTRALAPWGLTAVIHTLTGIGAGLGKPRLQLKSSILALVFGAGLFAAGLPARGAVGVAWTVSLSVFAVACIYVFDFHRHVLPVPLAAFARRGLLLPLLPALLALPVALVVGAFGSATDRLGAAVRLVPAGVVYVGLHLWASLRMGVLDRRDLELLRAALPGQRARPSSQPSV